VLLPWKEAILMTTPERLKRRQYLLGFLVMVMGLALIAQAVYFNHEDQRQKACLITQIHGLTTSMEARAALTERESAANRRIWSIYAKAAGYLKDDPTKPLPKDVQDRLNTALVASLLDYQAVMDDIESSRKTHPIPPYPQGRCD
jgi:hypothetical protein